MASISDLKQIIGSDADGEADANLQLLLRQADVIWANLSGGDSGGNTAEAIELIKCFLAAHIWTVTNERGGVREVDIGNTSEEYATGAFNVTGLSLTRFGQQALAIDVSGFLKGADKKELPALFEVF